MTYTPEITVQACGRAWTLHRATSLEALWDNMTTTLPSNTGGVDVADDERLPYWTELWPSSMGLAQWLERQKEAITGRTCVDIGCGLGLTAMIGQWLGARVLAMDYEEEALYFARRNALANGVPQPLWTVMDWRRPAMARGVADHIWGGDIMYERRFVDPVLRFLEYALAPQGRVWIAEPCRSVYDVFRAALLQRGWTGRPMHTACVDPLYAQPVRVTVHVWELTRSSFTGG